MKDRTKRAVMALHPTDSITSAPDINEALRQAPSGLIGPRRLIAAGIKRGNGQLVVKAAEQAVQPTQAPLVAATEPRDWSAAAVAHTHSQVYADVQDLFEGIDPDSLLDDVFASPDADASLVAYEQLVTGDWDGEL